MSLTDFVSKEDVRKRFNEEYPNQGERAETELKAEWRTQNYGVIGTAFDYLLRFWLQRNTPEVHSYDWVVENGLMASVFMEDARLHQYEKAINRADERAQEFLDSGELTDDLIKSSIDLAKLDIIYRANTLPTDLGEYNDEDLKDLRLLLNLAADSDELQGEEVYLNPDFGYASKLVSGADCDVILDGVLIDIKTTSKATFKSEYWRQLTGYLLLNDIHMTLQEQNLSNKEDGEVHPELPEIQSFGVYYARHGELSAVSASEIYDDEQYPEFREWFINRAIEYSHPEQRIADAVREVI